MFARCAVAASILFFAPIAIAAGGIMFPIDNAPAARQSAAPANVTISVPSGLRVVVSKDGCISPEHCPLGRGVPRNFYHASSKTIVLALDQGPESLAHERCHAHQDLMVRNENAGKTSSDSSAWERTDEGRAWIVATGGTIRMWPQMSERTHIEDFACTCALYLTDPDRLKELDPLRFNIARELLDKHK